MLHFRGVSVCLSVTRFCIVLKRQKISTLFLLHTTALCVFQIALKFGLHRSTPPPILSVGDIRWKIAAEWLGIAQWSQWRPYRKPPSLF